MIENAVPARAVAPVFCRLRFWVAGGMCAVLHAALVVLGPVSAPQPDLQNDEVFLDQIEQRAFRYFCDHTDPATGLTRDRAPFDGAPSAAPASIAASGFALTAWCIGLDRGWLDRKTAMERVLAVLRFADRTLARQRGWIYHYVDIHTGARVWQSEVSTIDTALFLQGAILAREYLGSAEVSRLVNRLYARIDWTWALNGGRTFSHGWRPETGFLTARWDSYSELLGLYLLGIGAPAHALPPESWNAWRREPIAVFGARTYVSSPSLFTHQYPHAWFDFRGRHDRYIDYWQNSVDATLAQREWSASLTHRFRFWSSDLWGLTASDSARGYVNWGGPQGPIEWLDGTLVPSAPAGSMPFAPKECLNALRRMLAVGGARVWGRYGFADAFNPETGWVSPDVIAIDLGITLAMVENLRSGFCWKYFMRAPETQRAFALAGIERQSPDRPFQSALLARAARELKPLPAREPRPLPAPLPQRRSMVLERRHREVLRPDIAAIQDPLPSRARPRK